MVQCYVEVGTKRGGIKLKNIKRVHDLTGEKFGRLTVIGMDDRNTRKTFWICQCECGGIKSVRSDGLLSGATKSCGCMKKETDATNLVKGHKHKLSGTRLYKIWQGIKKRCNSPNDPRYNRYGGRGIKICEEWAEDFAAFYEWAMSNGYKDDLTIDRKDNDGDYNPENCRWATNKEQCNNRSTNILIKIGNVTKDLTEWCNIFEVDYKKTVARYHRNELIGIDELFNDKS